MQFIVPAQPKLRMSPPVGDPWIHEVKLNAVRQVTAKKRYARALAAVTDWCRTQLRTRRAYPHPRAACRTGYEDTGPPCLLRHIGQLSTTQLVHSKVARIWQKWLSRRGSLLPWDRFTGLLKRHPLPAARIVHHYTAESEALP